MRALIEKDEDVAGKRLKLDEAVTSWWSARAEGIEGLTSGMQLMQLRLSLLDSFQQIVQPFGLLDEFEVTGVIASWWGACQNDLRTLAARGFPGLVEAWETSIVTALEDKRNRTNPLDHKLVRRLLPEYLADIQALLAKKAHLEATVKAGSDGEEEDEANGEEVLDELPEEELKAAKRDLSAVRKQLKELQKDFVARLQKARSELDEAAARGLVLGIFETQLRTILERYVARQSDSLFSAFETWWDKYSVTLSAIEQNRDQAAEQLRGFLGSLGYDK